MSAVAWVLMMVGYNHAVTARVYQTEQQCITERLVLIYSPNVRDLLCVPVVMQKPDAT